MRKKKIKRGFTLVEVLVTVVIVVMVAGISTVSYMGLQTQSRDKTRQANATIIAEQLEKYYDKNGEYPSVPSLVGQAGAAVKDKLNLLSSDVLVMPQSPSGTTNSLTQSQASPTQLAYNGQSPGEENDTCQTDANGGCDKFNLQWENESGESAEIPSRRSGRFAGVGDPTPPAAPSPPSMSVGFVDPNIVATTSTVACEPGATPEYKIIGATNTTGDDPVFSAWTTVSWQSSLTKSTAATEGTHYYYKAIARCVDGSGASGASGESEVVEYYHATAGAPEINATISGTAVSVVVTPITCPIGSTAKYQIRQRIDTTSATGTMAIIPTRDFTTTATYSTTAGGASSPTKHVFRAYSRCDSGSSQGTVSPASDDAIVVSAPAAPTLTKNVSGTSGTVDSVTWDWTPGSACPVGTSMNYQRVWTGDYTNAGSSTNTGETTISLTTSSQGYQYGMRVRASCGAAVANKVLQSSYSSDVTYIRDIDSVAWVYKGSIRTRRPEPGNTPQTVYGQAIVHATRNVNYEGGWFSSTPNQDYPPTGGCATGLTRKVQWQWALDDIGGGEFGYNDTVGAVNNGNYSPEYTWASNTSKTFPSGTSNSDFTSEGMRDLDKNADPGDPTSANSNSKVEFAFRVRCINENTAPASYAYGPYRRSDPFGNLTVVSNTGLFHTFCEAEETVPWCKAWHSKRNPLSSHVGEWVGDHEHSDGTAAAPTGTCEGGVAPNDKYCFTPDYSSNSAPWGW